jgi:hypothetical protein
MLASWITTTLNEPAMNWPEAPVSKIPMDMNISRDQRSLSSSGWTSLPWSKTIWSPCCLQVRDVASSRMADNSDHTRTRTKQRCRLCSSATAHDMRIDHEQPASLLPTQCLTPPIAAFTPPCTMPQHGEPIGGSVEEWGGSHYPICLLHFAHHSCNYEQMERYLF